MVMELSSQANPQNENICVPPWPHHGQTDQTAGLNSLPVRGLEEYKDREIRLYWEIKGLGRFYILSPEGASRRAGTEKKSGLYPVKR